MKQAKKRKERLEKPIKSTEEDKDAKSDQSAALAHVDSTRLTCRSFDGAIHSKELCIWCMKPGDKRHKKAFFNASSYRSGINLLYSLFQKLICFGKC